MYTTLQRKAGRDKRYRAVDGKTVGKQREREQRPDKKRMGEVEGGEGREKEEEERERDRQTDRQTDRDILLWLAEN